MAIITGPLNSTQVSGKVNNLIFARNQFGAYTRGVVPVSMPNTPDQLIWQNAMTTLAGNWENNLTQEQRDGWNNFGKLTKSTNRLGQSTIKPGRNWFVKFNIFRIASGLGFRNFPPVNNSLNYIPSFTIQQIDDGIELIPSTAPSSEELLYISKIPAQNIGRNFPPNNNNFSRWIRASDSPPFIVRPNDELTATEKKYFFRIIAIDDFGIPSKPQWTSILATKGETVETFIADDYNRMNQFIPNSVVNNVDLTLLSNENNGKLQNSTFHFNFSSIPGGSTISSAIVSIFQRGNLNSQTIECWNIIVGNSTTFISWNNRLSGTAWNTPGGGAGTDLGAAEIAIVSTNGGVEYKAMDITSWVQDVIDSITTNQGLMFKYKLATFSDMSYATQLEADSNKHPKLVITYL